MHHDVRTPMMLPDPNNNLRMYANPLRTTFHRCEISQPQTAAATTPCEYHSCCAPLTERRFCISALEASRRNGYPLTDVEPEECERYVLEHRHHRREHLGMSVSEPQPMEVDMNGEELLSPPPYGSGFEEREIREAASPKWRDDLDQLLWRDDNGNISSGATSNGGLAPITVPFAHLGRFRDPYEERLFLEAEKLYTLVCDAETHYAVLRDLSCGAMNVFSSLSSPSGSVTFRHWEPMAFATSTATMAGLNYVRAREKLEFQRDEVASMLRWAGEPCLRCW